MYNSCVVCTLRVCYALSVCGMHTLRIRHVHSTPQYSSLTYSFKYRSSWVPDGFVLADKEVSLCTDLSDAAGCSENLVGV